MPSALLAMQQATISDITVQVPSGSTPSIYLAPVSAWVNTFGNYWDYHAEATDTHSDDGLCDSFAEFVIEINCDAAMGYGMVTAGYEVGLRCKQTNGTAYNLWTGDFLIRADFPHWYRVSKAVGAAPVYYKKRGTADWTGPHNFTSGTRGWFDHAENFALGLIMSVDESGAYGTSAPPVPNVDGSVPIVAYNKSEVIPSGTYQHHDAVLVAMEQDGSNDSVLVGME